MVEVNDYVDEELRQRVRDLPVEEREVERHTDWLVYALNEYRMNVETVEDLVDLYGESVEGIEDEVKGEIEKYRTVTGNLVGRYHDDEGEIWDKGDIIGKVVDRADRDSGLEGSRRALERIYDMVSDVEDIRDRLLKDLKDSGARPEDEPRDIVPDGGEIEFYRTGETPRASEHGIYGWFMDLLGEKRYGSGAVRVPEEYDGEVERIRIKGAPVREDQSIEVGDYEIPGFDGDLEVIYDEAVENWEEFAGDVQEVPEDIPGDGTVYRVMDGIDFRVPGRWLLWAEAETEGGETLYSGDLITGEGPADVSSATVYDVDGWGGTDLNTVLREDVWGTITSGPYARFLPGRKGEEEEAHAPGSNALSHAFSALGSLGKAGWKALERLPYPTSVRPSRENATSG